jgi:competence protein ComEC
VSGWRQALLAGIAAGLALSPYLPQPRLEPAATIALVTLAALALTAIRPRGTEGTVPAVAWLACLALVAAAAGLVAGHARLGAIDGGAFRGSPGERVSVRGAVSGVPRPQQGRLLVPLETADGRLFVEAPPGPDLDVGAEVRADGVVRAPPPWQAERLRIQGIERIVAARTIEPTGRRRGGVPGLLDGVRDRAEDALERGVPEAEAALARGFVLGQDDRIDGATVDEFRRSGLAHLLAVSGQNVLLLALLAMPVLALLGVPLRARLVTVIALIALYVPVTGAGPSIQRAAVMGAAGTAAMLAGRPGSRVHVLLLAAAATLALNPRAAADVGWQLSFAAVVGILLWARPISSLVLRHGREDATPLRRGLADGVGVTVAATLATAPISAAHFETVSLASLPANLLALPAVAPVMWLGMLAAALGQVPAIPVEPLNWLSSLLVAYIAQVAHWLGGPGWTSQEVTAPGPAALAGITVALVVGGAIAARWLARRSALRGARPPWRILGAAALVPAALFLPLPGRPPPAATVPDERLDLTVLDVGQGEAILLDPAPGDPVLVDAGPPGAGVGADIAARGIDRLAAVVVTHDQSDHAGGLAEVLRTVPAAHVVHAGAGREPRALAETAGAEPRSLAAGDAFRSGALRLRVLWPRETEGRPPPGTDPNQRSLVLLARWHHFDVLLTGDAEAEAVPLDPGRIDMLKVAHHGSEDAGLPALLERTDPGLAAISAGAGNPYGHPHPSTLTALAEAGVPVTRTDSDGDVEIEVARDGFALTG